MLELRALLPPRMVQKTRPILRERIMPTRTETVQKTEQDAETLSCRSLPGQRLPGKIEMHAVGLKRGDAHNSIDSRQRVFGGRRQEYNR
jgi:hypothetical protein